MSDVASILVIQCFYKLIYAYQFYLFLKICKSYIFIMNNKKIIVREIVFHKFIAILCIMSNVASILLIQFLYKLVYAVFFYFLK